MASIVTKEITITNDNAKTYCVGTILELAPSTYAFALYLDGAKDGWAHLNDAAKAVIYPTATAHPFKLDSSITGSRSGGTMYVHLEYDDQELHTCQITSITKQAHNQSDIVGDVISNSTRATKIGWHVAGSSTVSDFRVKETTIRLYFNQYQMIGNKAKRAKGVESIIISSNAPYEGDPVTFSPVLVEGAKWYGWYSDEAHTQLVTTDMDYTVTAGADLTLYAYATLGTGFNVKKDGEWVNSIDIFKKIDGVWSLIEKEDVDLSKQYTVEFIE